MPLHQDAGQGRSGLVLFGGDPGDPADQRAEFRLRDFHASRSFGHGQGGELLARQGVQVQLAAPGPELDSGVAVCGLDADLAVWEALDQVAQQGSGDSNGPFPADLHVCLGLDADAELEVGGGEAEASVLGLEQDALQDGERAALAGQAGNAVYGSRQCVSWDGELHGVLLQGWWWRSAGEVVGPQDDPGDSAHHGEPGGGDEDGSREE